MTAFPRHHLRPALLALAALAGLLLAPGGAAASGCSSMKSTGTCPPSTVACCCNPVAEPAQASAPSRPEVGSPSIAEPRASGGACSCEESPGSPAEPSRGSARPSDERQAGSGDPRPDRHAGPRPGLRPIGVSPPTDDGPPHVPLYLRNSRFLI